MSRAEVARVGLLLSGMVQGVGLRPFIFRLARQLGLTGFVGNSTSGVFVEIQGNESDIDAFQRLLTRDAPPPARIVEVQARTLQPRQEIGFRIVPSSDSAGAGVLVPDVATCDACVADVADPSNRRHNHPFASCCRCGPRYTIVRRLPFDRANTSMGSFPLCARCEAEYADECDRRHHAQTTSCHACGPVLRLEGDPPSAGAAAIERARRHVQEGAILAIKGLGGFHLACDATNDAAVRRLRERKGRDAKPLAMMAANIGIVRRYAHAGSHEEELLTSRERPIVLLRRAPGGYLVSPSVSSGTDRLGFMLPYTPVHHVLLDDRPLVMTSGNLSGEPIVWNDDDARRKLADVADVLLMHDREIVAPCEDSVMRSIGGAAYPIRRSRGFVPLPIAIPPSRPVLAVGGDLKGAICLAARGQAFLGPHLGDMQHPAALELLGETVDRFRDLFRIEPEVVACDAHPGYHTSQWAAEFARRRSLPLVRVQHHRAHVAALLADCRRSEPIIGVCFDGTGYGDDGSIWGGEFFTGDGVRLERVAHLEPVPLPGGDASVERPYRMALSWLHASGMDWDENLPCVRDCPPAERSILKRQRERGLNCVPASSVGRLFDAVSALIGVCNRSTYEGQAAIELEALVDESETDAYAFTLPPGSPMTLDARPVIRAIVQDMRGSVPPPVIAARFHRGLAAAVVAVCRIVRERSGLNHVGLTGGVFQNVTLLELLLYGLRAERFEVLIHRQVPPNDGGLSLGQARLAVAGEHRNA